MKQHNNQFFFIFLVLLASIIFPFSITQAAIQKKETIAQITNNNYGSIKVIDGKIILGDRLK